MKQTAYVKAVTTSSLPSAPKTLLNLCISLYLPLRGRTYRQLILTSPVWVVHLQQRCTLMLNSTTGWLRPASPSKDSVRIPEGFRCSGAHYSPQRLNGLQQTRQAAQSLPSELSPHIPPHQIAGKNSWQGSPIKGQHPSAHTLLQNALVRWAGHVSRMPDSRLTKQLLYGEHCQGNRSVGSTRHFSKTASKGPSKRPLTVYCRHNEHLNHFYLIELPPQTSPHQMAGQKKSYHGGHIKGQHPARSYPSTERPGQIGRPCLENV